MANNIESKESRVVRIDKKELRGMKPSDFIKHIVREVNNILNPQSTTRMKYGSKSVAYRKRNKESSKLYKTRH